MGKESTYNAGDARGSGSIPGSEGSPGGGHGHPLQYSCLENTQGQRSLAGYSPRGHKEPDMTRGTVHTHISKISKSGNKIKKKRKDHVVKKSRLRTATIPRYKTDS